MTKEDTLIEHCDILALCSINEHSSVLNAMEEYAKQQAIAFVKHNCPDINLDDSLLSAGYAGFLMKQNESK